MFVWDFVLGDVMNQLINWLFGQLVGFLGNFFSKMGNMGAELFEYSWVQYIVLYFSYLAWTLYATGLVVACFETGIEYQYGRGNFKDMALNAIKGFMDTSLLTIAPIELYKLFISLQAKLTAGITGYGSGIGEVANGIIGKLQNSGDISYMAGAGVFGGLNPVTNPFMGVEFLAKYDEMWCLGDRGFLYP